VQPVQLSLMPHQVPAPRPAPIEQVPEPQLAAAIALLAGLIAKAADPRAAGQGDGDE
jgi:hypothetical protein